MVASSAGGEVRHPDGRLQLKRRTIPRSPLRVWSRRVLLAVLAVIIVVGAVTVLQSFRARADLVAGRQAMERGRSAIVRSDLESALSAFEQARTAFRAAEDHLANPVVAAAAAVPVAGDTVQTARMLSRAGASVAEAGVELSGGALRLPEGLATLAPVDGVIPVRAVAAIAPFLQRASDLVGVALQDVRSAPDGRVLGVVARAREEFLGQIGQIDGLLQAAATLSDALPSFLGSEEPRRYFFGAQSLAEARSLGGCICAYTLLEVDGGQLSFGEFVTTTTIGGVTVDAPPPTEEFGRRYEPYGSAGLLSTVNYSADLPTVSQAILNIYEHVEGERLDGVILADAYVLEALVRATGPVDIPQVGLVPASEIVATLSNDAYDALPDSNARKALLGQVAAATLEGFLQRGAA
ncbi:MAG TPA: DUF4012 domain-containing protein, partial [Euzebya sp.]|nr:DUF4012 domain-containing protein [Euzebya sp.]